MAMANFVGQIGQGAGGVVTLIRLPKPRRRAPPLTQMRHAFFFRVCFVVVNEKTAELGEQYKNMGRIS